MFSPETKKELLDVIKYWNYKKRRNMGIFQIGIHLKLLI
jgi:hypothetical protein